MSREIKFRGLDKPGKKMLYGLPAYLDIRPVATIRHIEYEPGSMDEIIPETLGQYTGLKDSTGKEIYEGDIVKITQTCDYTGDETIIIAGIVWCARTLRWRLGNEYKKFGLEFAEDIEVIGNIHENPELVK